MQTSRRFDESVCLDRTVTHDITVPRKAEPGDAVAIVSPSFAAPEFFPAVHEQALQRLTAITGLVPVEYPTTRKTSSPQDRARDLNEAFADPSIRAVLAVVGGEDQITVIPHLDPAAVRADPKPFLGYSDNTNILNWLWCHGVAGFYGGSTQVHLGPGPAVDACHAASLRRRAHHRRTRRDHRTRRIRRHRQAMGRPRSTDRVRHTRSNRAVAMGGPRAVRDRANMGRMR
jgi:muramoyltetrapeptide carboxypeptidase LdcA involved in peptidoglycan recycling